MSSAPLPAPEAFEQAPPESPSWAPAVPFWQQARVVNIISFGSSLLLHIVPIALVLIFSGPLRDVLRAPTVEQLVIPDAAMVEGAQIGGIPNPGLGGDPNRAAAQDQVKDVSNPDAWKQRRGDSLSQSLMGETSGEAPSDSIIAPGLRSGIGGGPPTATGGGYEGGALAPFGVPGGGGGAGPRANFIGVSGNARTVAYVCDASGSMLNMMFALKAELRKAIDPLRPIQAFNVIFFADKDKPQALSPGQLLVANADNKRKAYEFLGTVTTAGATNPIPGLETAFKGKPQLVYLLTDGNFPNNEAVLAKIRELNSSKKTKVNTILFCDAANIEPGIKELLKQIADENGGISKVVDTKDY